MPRFDKWLTAVGPDAPIQRAARKAIESRLAAVGHFLQQAAEVTGRPDDDAEAVHQLRIWTRRAAAALRLFRDLLPRRRAKRLGRKLRQLRRAAGKARDADVLGQQLEQADEPALAHVAIHLRQKRNRAERKLATFCKSLVRRGRLARQGRKLLDKTRWRRHKTPPKYGPWCRGQLRPLCERFFELASADLAKDPAIHELRLAGKRLRYALELAPAAIAAPLHRRLYDELSDLQDRLGALCDAMVAVVRMRQWRADARDPASRKHLQAALRRQEQHLASRRRRFVRWWSVRRRQQMQRTWEKAIDR